MITDKRCEKTTTCELCKRALACLPVHGTESDPACIAVVWWIVRCGCNWIINTCRVYIVVPLMLRVIAMRVYLKKVVLDVGAGMTMWCDHWTMSYATGKLNLKWSTIPAHIIVTMTPSNRRIQIKAATRPSTLIHHRCNTEKEQHVPCS